jgi:Protein of unknown function (DUF2975)
MRAIGKGSLASILAMGLNITRIILWLAFIGFSIALVVIPFASIIYGMFQGFDGGDALVDGADYIQIAYQFVSFGVMLFVVSRLLEVLKTLRFGSPFVKENAEHFRTVGYALLIGEGAKIAFGFLSLITSADIEIDTQPITWLAIITVFVLAEVFHEGARMKEEQDLTV